MKWRLAVFPVLLIGALLLVIFVPYVVNTLKSWLTYNACDYPMPYRIGSVDSRFGLSSSDVTVDIQQAVQLWNSAEGKSLFQYVPNARLTVNFVYDQRQALNSQIQQLNSSLSQKDASLQQKVADFKAQQAAFEQKLAAFNALVDKYNSEGGAPPDVYKSLIAQQNDLNSQAQILNATAKQLNLSTYDYNTGVSSLNQDITQLNSELSQKPEEGLYDSGSDTITIYLTNSRAELVHTLAHEFGHALGMVHVGGATSIMYPYTSSSLAITPQDLQQLKFVCRQQSGIVHVLFAFDQWVMDNAVSLREDFLKK